MVFHWFLSSFSILLGICNQGFRKIGTDKWEFANEAFQQGKRHLLKNIQRRRSPQSQQIGSYIGPSSEAGNCELEIEVERLRKERSMLMQEVVDLQQQQRKTVSHAREVNQRLQSAEQRQKLMVSFLAKLFQNPAFLDRLKQKNEHREIGSPRGKRRLVTQHHHETGTSEDSLKEGQIMRFQSNWRNITIPSEEPELNPVSIKNSPNYLPRGMASQQNPTLGIENVESDELDVVNEIMVTPEIMGEGSLTLGLEDHLIKGNKVMSPDEEIVPEFYIPPQQDLNKEKGFPDFSPLGTESIMKQDLWNPCVNFSHAASISENELWGSPINYEVAQFGVTGSVPDIWNISPLEAASLGNDKGPTDEFCPTEYE